MDALHGDKTGATQGCVYVKIRQTERMQIIKAEHWLQEQLWLWKNPAPKIPEVESMSLVPFPQPGPDLFPFIHIPQPFFPSSVSFEENMNLLAKEPRCSFLLRSASEQSLCDSTKADWGTLFEPVPLKWATELLSWSSSAQNYQPFENVFPPPKVYITNH